MSCGSEAEENFFCDIHHMKGTYFPRRVANCTLVANFTTSYLENILALVLQNDSVSKIFIFLQNAFSHKNIGFFFEKNWNFHETFSNQKK